MLNAIHAVLVFRYRLFTFPLGEKMAAIIKISDAAAAAEETFQSTLFSSNSTFRAASLAS